LTHSRGNCVQDVHQWIDPLHQPFIAVSELIKGLGFALNCVLDGLSGLAALQFFGKRAVCKVISGSDLYSFKAASRIDLKCEEDSSVWEDEDIP
jgi:hypothetical protein